MVPVMVQICVSVLSPACDFTCVYSRMLNLQSDQHVNVVLGGAQVYKRFSQLQLTQKQPLTKLGQSNKHLLGKKTQECWV